MQINVIIISNPLAGKEKQEISYSSYSNINVVKEIDITTDNGDIMSILEESVYDLIFICGGDGTVSSVLSMLSQYDIQKPVAIIPLGTANDIAKSIYTTIDIDSIINSISLDSLFEFDLGKINNHIFSYAFSFGYLTDVQYETNQRIKNRLGFFAYLLNALPKLPKIKSYKLKIKTDNTVIRGSYSFCSILNTKSLANMINFEDEYVSLDDGKFELLLVKTPMSPSKYFSSLYKLRNNIFDTSNVILISTKSLTIESSQQIDYGIDGEYGGKSNNFEFNVMNSAIRVAGPLSILMKGVEFYGKKCK
ncbi:YegS/Rv2252/BmrU family lipid kinase [Erysipelothrix sp. HDW6A]|uniref:diacylglycerol/lipid kinase family protein n=1 Tax=Erysipelothrix sp. HDW6A TaxID=2714928 RepID=UPI00140D4210|nr:YegS/Rv2252/BmrU family lipid kinase [Erysipelothrix sp. HDW6A]QIK57513.1 YegS/Rv2252/BmrU family lipid kinase [Erysipelothrix sp. HDW6A]